jgi:hypothetical protein
MLLLNSTTALLQLVTAQATAISVHASYADRDSAAFGTSTEIKFGTSDPASITTAATTTIVGSPGNATTTRNIQHIGIENTHASLSNALTINHFDGTVTATLFTLTLLPGESLTFDENGVWWYFGANGAQIVSSTIPATAWASPGTIGSTAPNTGAFTTLSATGAVTFNGANAALSLSPTGTGTVAISPVGALTINPTAASTINNASVGATTRATGAFSLIGAGGASNAAAFITTAAGTTTVAPATITGGTNLTTAAAGALENDAINAYFTTNTGDGRGRIPVEQKFRLTANGTAFNTISNFFGATSNISLVSGAFYEIEIEVYFTKTTAEAVTWTFTNSVAPTSMNIHYEQSPITGIVAPGSTSVANIMGDLVNSTTAAQTIVTGVLTTAVNHYAKFKIRLANSTGTSLKIQAACTTASGITPLRGSTWRSQRIPTGNTGTFAA